MYVKQWPLSAHKHGGIGGVIVLQFIVLPTYLSVFPNSPALPGLSLTPEHRPQMSCLSQYPSLQQKLTASPSLEE